MVGENRLDCHVSTGFRIDSFADESHPTPSEHAEDGEWSDVRWNEFGHGEAPYLMPKRNGDRLPYIIVSAAPPGKVSLATNGFNVYNTMCGFRVWRF